MMLICVVALVAGSIASTAEASGVSWTRVADSQDTFEPTAEEVERRRFESWIFDRLNVREYGKFDMLHQYNGHMLRLGTTKVPPSLEVMLHVLNSPILHDSIFNALHLPESIASGIPFLGVPVRLPQGGAAHNLVVAVLGNDTYALKRYSGFKRREPTWSTYLDNEAAYTYMWRLLSRQVKINLHRQPINVHYLATHLPYCYRNDNNEILIFKYHVTMDHQQHNHFAGLISQWTVGRLPLHDDYLDMFNDELASLDRSEYPLEMFDNLGRFSSFVSGDAEMDVNLLMEILDLPILKPTLSFEQCLDAEARHIAKVTLRFAHTLMARMLEKHAIPAFAALSRRKALWRVHGVTGPLRRLRSAINEHLASIKNLSSASEFESSQQLEEIEEILFESSTKFNPYWSMKNDTLYKTADLINFHEVKNLGLLFEPDNFVQRLMNIRGELIDFREIHDILHRLTAARSDVKFSSLFEEDDSTCKVVTNLVDKVDEQYKSLPENVRKRLVAKCRCLLAFLYLFGVVDRKGHLDFPNGWPRNVTKSLTYITDGIASSCGLCNSILGFLSGIGYPPVVDNMYAWETRKTHVESAVYQLLVTSKRSNHKAHTEYFDKTLLSYISGHYKDDDISSLAVGYYIYSGIGNPSRLLDDVTVRSGVERFPKGVGNNCIEALPFVIDAAKAAMHSRTPPNLDDGNEEYRSRSYAEFVKNLAKMGDADGLRVMGDFHYAGHEEGNISIDVPRALEYWTMAAQQGDVTSSLTVASHLINLMNGDAAALRPSPNRRFEDPSSMTPETLSVEGYDRQSLERAAEGYLRIAADSHNPIAAATARFNMSRYGIGEPRDPVAAARHLKESADRGDVTSQMLMGHAYAGLLKDITPADGKNVFMALEYYRRASKSGNIVATFNTAVLTLHGYDLKYNSSIERCKASFGLFQHVGRYALMPAAVSMLAKRAAYHGDNLGHTLMNLFLSEMGDPAAHIRAARQFKNSSQLCYVGSDKSSDTTATAATTTTTTAAAATTTTTGMGILAPFQQRDQPSGPSPCYLFYARRSGYEPNGGSPLTFAEALMETNPKESVEWVIDAKLKNEPKANYIYATMLEGGVGMSQDCKASYNYFCSMTESKDFSTKMIGFLCIQRGRASHLLSYWREAYEWFVTTFYDQSLVSHLLAEGYTPCRYEMPTIALLNVTADRIVTVAFMLLLIFSSIVYIRLN